LHGREHLTAHTLHIAIICSIGGLSPSAVFICAIIFCIIAIGPPLWPICAIIFFAISIPIIMGLADPDCAGFESRAACVSLSLGSMDHLLFTASPLKTMP
jgi:hypothetical protein